MKPQGLTPTELATRWGVDMRTVRRRRAFLRMREAGFTGTVPVYPETEVERAEREWQRHMRRVHQEQRKRASRPRKRRQVDRVLSMREIRQEAAQ